MAGGTGSWDTSIEGMFAALDALHAAETTRKGADLGRLRVLVAGIGIGSAPEPDGPPPPRAPGEFRDSERPAPVQYPLLPRRTTHGGPFGASVIDRVVANMRREDPW
jgi:hypothetical protein